MEPVDLLGERHHLARPGLVDCHQHAAPALVRSLIAHELPGSTGCTCPPRAPGPGLRPEVQRVVVAGRLLVEDGAFTTTDAEALWARCREAGPRVAAVVEPRRYRTLAPRPSPAPR